MVQDSACIDKYITFDFGDLTPGKIFNLHFPMAFRLVPSCADDFVVCLAIFAEAMLIHKVVEICINLLCGSIHP